MAQKRQDAFALLTQVSDLLARGNRARERDDFNAAHAFGQDAQLRLTAFDNWLGATDVERHPEAQAQLRIIQFRLALFEAVLCAHGRTPAQNEQLFAALRERVTEENLPHYFAARVEVCHGAVLIYQDDARAAIRHLRAAYSWLDDSPTAEVDRSRVDYHRARVYIKLGKTRRARTLLQGIMPDMERSGAWIDEPRHIVAAAIRLAALEWSLWSRRRRRYAKDLLASANRSAANFPVEANAIRFIGRFGFIAHWLMPPERVWPEF